MYQDTRRPMNFMVLAIAVGCGLIAAITVARLVKQPMDAIQNQVFAPGDADLAVRTNSDDLVAKLIDPGQFVDVLTSEEPRADGKKSLRILAERVLVVAVTDQPAGTAPAGTAPAAPTLTLRLTKQQADELRPFQDTGTLRFIVRENEEKK